MEFGKNRENSFGEQSVVVKILSRRDLPAQFVRFVMDFWVCKLRMNCSADLSQGQNFSELFQKLDACCPEAPWLLAEVKHCQPRGSWLSFSVAKYDPWYGFSSFFVTGYCPPIEACRPYVIEPGRHKHCQNIHGLSGRRIAALCFVQTQCDIRLRKRLPPVVCYLHNCRYRKPQVKF